MLGTAVAVGDVVVLLEEKEVVLIVEEVVGVNDSAKMGTVGVREWEVWPS